ncbi:MAG: nucleotide exchange factor GrpE [Elusimicrobiota bacterium]|nr:nucleotide exchange factor GrpE [Elusimicrobiota bacterium]
MEKEKEKEKEIENDKEDISLEEDAKEEEKPSELEILKQSLEDKKKESQDYFDQLLILKADFENFRKRSEKEKRDFLEWGKEKILVKQISMNDVLQQALKSAKSGGKVEDIIIGLDMVNKEFDKMLSDEGIEELKIEKFDPNTCEALDYVESDEEDGTILEFYQKGYQMNGRLIRTAKVKVAKKKEEKE